MSEPLKKPDQAPESYTPKEVPEIISMTKEQAEQSRKIDKTHLVQSEGGSSRVDFGYPFCGFRALDFTNCFASLYMYLEDFAGEAEVLKQQQERLFFLFDTVSGRSASLRGWGDLPTDIYREIYDSDSMIDFLMGYTGYAYAKYTDDIAQQIRASINRGLPVLVRLNPDVAVDRSGYGDSFRIITGFQNGKLLMPEPKGAQYPPKKAPKPGEIESVYVITGTAARKYTLLDGLKRIRRVMDCDRENEVWDEYIQAFSNSWEKLDRLTLKELKQLFKSAHEGTTWNCHNFAAPFRTHEYLEPEPERYQNWIWDELRNPLFFSKSQADDIWDELQDPVFLSSKGRIHGDPLRLPPKTLIDWATDQSHTRQWQLHALYETRDWSKKYYQQMEWGTCETAVLLLQKIKECDDYIYHAVCAMIEILEVKSK